MRILAILAAALCLGCAQQHEAVTAPMPIVAPVNDRAAIVAASVYGYEINLGKKCPCPYSQGGACKGKSAYERKGGAKPRCYQTDVAEAEVSRWQHLVNAAPERPQPVASNSKKKAAKADPAETSEKIK
jgi:hypothetical protein